MRKQRTEYKAPLDALIAVTKRLNAYEERFKIDSEDFYDRFSKGALEDSIDFTEWSNDYRHYLNLKFKIEKLLSHVA